MNIADLTKLGAFVSPSLKKVKVTWLHDKDGEDVEDTFHVFIKRLSYGDFERVYKGNDQAQSALLISECVFFGEKGEERMTYEQAYSLETSFALAIVEAINKEFDTSAKKQKTKKSGTS